MIEAVREVTGHEIPAKVVPRRSGDPSTLIASSEKAKTVLGWNPQRTSIKQIIEDAWSWHQAHPHGYND
ncbi:UDP-glucose 4-epimerase [Mycobacteroides abscessus subsp. abscessus]|nr:UDP-glucose 4-epimerase [Mycobacteroides abscessus subsp. abscessus]